MILMLNDIKQLFFKNFMCENYVMIFKNCIF